MPPLVSTVDRSLRAAPAIDPLVASTGLPASIAALLAELEDRSRARPDRVLRLRGVLPAASSRSAVASEQPEQGDQRCCEPFELLIFRGFSSLTTHPTAFDPDRPALPEGSVIASAELLQAPLTPAAETLLAGPAPVAAFRAGEAWL
jgi:hypothetical protein